jgi:hypothetical protein
LFHLSGTDLTQIDGIDVMTASSILSEAGWDDGPSRRCCDQRRPHLEPSRRTKDPRAHSQFLASRPKSASRGTHVPKAGSVAVSDYQLL